MAATCDCGAKRNHPIHLRALNLDGYHPWRDPSQAGLKPISDGRREYLASNEHKAAYGAQIAPVCVFEAAGAPMSCSGPLTKHHLFPRGRAGSLERAERVAPVANACAEHNRWVSQDAEGIAFGETHWITIGGRDWPLLMSDADARDLEAEGREFKPASSLSASNGTT